MGRRRLSYHANDVVAYEHNGILDLDFGRSYCRGLKTFETLLSIGNAARIMIMMTRHLYQIPIKSNIYSIHSFWRDHDASPKKPTNKNCYILNTERVVYLFLFTLTVVKEKENQ